MDTNPRRPNRIEAHLDWAEEPDQPPVDVNRRLTWENSDTQRAARRRLRVRTRENHDDGRVDLEADDPVGQILEELVGLRREVSSLRAEILSLKRRL